MAIIYVISVIFLLVVIAFTWYTLETIEINKKILFLIFGIVLSIFVTTILFNISSCNIEYYNNQILQSIRKIIVILFIPINAIAIMPFLGKQISKYGVNKNKLIKNLVIFVVILIIVFILEIRYLNYIQNGIIEIIEGLVNNK